MHTDYDLGPTFDKVDEKQHLFMYLSKEISLFGKDNKIEKVKGKKTKGIFSREFKVINYIHQCEVFIVVLT